jgi:hypothetical protein
MKEVMRQLASLRDKHRVAILVVHHTKKGTRYESMHNDNMRGSSVFSGASDSVLMFRRSAKDEKLRLIKPTKLRHGDDDIRKARLLELNPGILWFSEIGEVNESDHIEKQETSSSNDDANIEWSIIFGSDINLARKDIVRRLQGVGKSKRTADRLISRDLFVLESKYPRFCTMM